MRTTGRPAPPRAAIAPFSGVSDFRPACEIIRFPVPAEAPQGNPRA